MININEKFKRSLLASCAIVVLTSYSASAHLTIKNEIEDKEDNDDKNKVLSSLLSTTFNEQMTKWNQENGGDAGNILTNFDELLNNFDPAAMLEETFDKAMEDIADTISGMADEITSKLESLFTSGPLADMVGVDKLKELANSVINLDDISNIIPELDDITDMIPDPQELVDEVVGKVEEQLGELTGMLEEIPEQLSKLDEEIIGKIEDLAQNANPEELLNGLKEMANSGDLSDVVQSKVDELTEAAEGLKDFQNLDSFTNLEDLQSKAEEAVGFVEDLQSKDAMESVQDMMGSNDFMDAIMNSEDIMGNITDSISPGVVSDAIEQMVSEGTISAEDAKSALEGIVNMDDAKQAMESLGLSTDSLPTDNEIVDAIVNGTYEEKIKEIQESLEEEIANLPEEFKSYGESAIEGIMGSITDSVQDNPFMESMEGALDIAGQIKDIENQIKDFSESFTGDGLGDYSKILSEIFPEIDEVTDEVLGLGEELTDFEKLSELANQDFEEYLGGLTEDLVDIGGLLDSASGMLGDLGGLGGLLGGGGEATVSTPVVKNEAAGAVESGELLPAVEAYAKLSDDIGKQGPIEKATMISQELVAVVTDGYSGSMLLTSVLEKEGQQTDATGASVSDQKFNELGKQEELTSLVNAELSLVYGSMSRGLSLKALHEAYKGTINSGLSIIEAAVPNSKE